jgi:GGDEF domain-containing protein
VAVWIFYVVFLVAYSLWSLRLTRNFAGDRRLGYLLCMTDTAILLPVLVWTSTAALRVALLCVCVCGLLFSYWSERSRARVAARTGQVEGDVEQDASTVGAYDTGLERALRVRLRVLETTQTRFALVVLRILRFEEIGAYYGEEASEHVICTVARRCLRLLGADAQHFVLPGGRVAYVFSTGSGSTRGGSQWGNTFELIDPYDIESFAMALGRKACEHLIDGHRVECVVGWAAAPADGLSPDDLMYAAESGAQSTDAFRRVAGSRVPVRERTRVAAG